MIIRMQDPSTIRTLLLETFLKSNVINAVNSDIVPTPVPNVNAMMPQTLPKHDQFGQILQTTFLKTLFLILPRVTTAPPTLPPKLLLAWLPLKRGELPHSTTIAILQEALTVLIVLLIGHPTSTSMIFPSTMTVPLPILLIPILSTCPP
jgi:hypothetical protein